MLALGRALALDEPFTVRVVVIGELFALPDLAIRADPDGASVDVDVTVRVAGVIDEARVVAADAGVDHRAIGELEAPDVAVLDVARLSLQTDLVGNLLARVVDDARVLRNRLRRVDAPPLNLLTPLFNHRLLRLSHVVR